MPFDAGCMGREMDEDICDSIDSLHVSYCRTSVVARTALPHRLVEPQHTVYRIGDCDADGMRTLAAMGSEDPERLQDLPASGQIHHVHRDAVQHCYRKGDVESIQNALNESYKSPREWRYR